MNTNTTSFEQATDTGTGMGMGMGKGAGPGVRAGTGVARGTGRTVRRAGALAAAAGLLTAGLLTGPASAAAPARPVTAPPTTLTACAFYRGTALTVPGQHGNRVKQVQCLLANRHYLTWNDLAGYFGAKTRTAVTKFQSGHHLPANGKVDTKTWHALYS
ncbi:peptidoglycan-binding domain-containing protein [Streptomyces sp. MspMP-M5]|uniref:peptidoglycan-binding domain-containing protein n=1 Tax=unclassified Streptomyces TaxID=2593676 RepID=UPI0003AB2ECC|nr:peptidoglycan-binding domain-containing protein [Streptomyces sp. MspMP-M5]